MTGWHPESQNGRKRSQRRLVICSGCRRTHTSSTQEKTAACLQMADVLPTDLMQSSQLWSKEKSETKPLTGYSFL